MTTTVEATNVEKTTSPYSDFIKISYPTRQSGIERLFPKSSTVGNLIGARLIGLPKGTS
jgi:hypothetical protein